MYFAAVRIDQGDKNPSHSAPCVRTATTNFRATQAYQIVQAPNLSTSVKTTYEALTKSVQACYKIVFRMMFRMEWAGIVTVVTI